MRSTGKGALVFSDSHEPEKAEFGAFVQIMGAQFAQSSCVVVRAFDETVHEVITNTYGEENEEVLRFEGVGHQNANLHLSMDIDDSGSASQTVPVHAYLEI